MAVFVPYPDDERLAMTGDEDIGFFVNCDVIFGEDGDSATVSHFAALMREVGKSSKESAVEAIVRDGE